MEFNDGGSSVSLFFLNATVNARDAVFVLCVCLSVMFGVVLFFFWQPTKQSKNKGMNPRCQYIRCSFFFKS